MGLIKYNFGMEAVEPSHKFEGIIHLQDHEWECMCLGSTVALKFWKTVVCYLVTYNNVCYILYNFKICWPFFMKRSTKIMQVDDLLCIV
jgi:hypothetical protein